MDVAVADPELFAAEAPKYELEERGVSIRGEALEAQTRSRQDVAWLADTRADDARIEFDLAFSKCSAP
jgi:hypothetical protein